MEEKVHITQVEILGETYTLRSEDDPEYVARVAAYVDGKFREIKGMAPTSSYLRTAVLAALNIADELHKLKIKDESREQQITERLGRIFNLLEKKKAGVRD